MPVTVVTGASSGIGRSLARRLAARGDTVALVARRGDRLAALAEMLRAEGYRALPVVADVTDRNAVRAAIERVTVELGPVETLVANAGGGLPTFVDAFDAAAAEAVIRLNLIGVINAVDAVLPGMLARGHGHLVAMGSLAGTRGLPGAGAYSAAKAGVANFMESLRVDLRGRGIAVTLIEPGFVRTKDEPERRRGRRKPFEIALEPATARMVRAIERRRPRAVIPGRLAAAAALLRLLPPACYDPLLAGRGRKPPGYGR